MEWKRTTKSGVMKGQEGVVNYAKIQVRSNKSENFPSDLVFRSYSARCIIEVLLVADNKINFD